MIAAALARYKMPAEILAALALLAGLLYGFHRFCESQREIGRIEIQQAWDKQKLADAETYRLRSEANQKAVDIALTQGAQREAVIKTLSASSVASAASLRDTIAAFNRSNSTASSEALIERANTASSLLGDCAAQYRSVAEKADRHANDAKTLTDAFPKN